MRRLALASFVLVFAGCGSTSAVPTATRTLTPTATATPPPTISPTAVPVATPGPVPTLDPSLTPDTVVRRAFAANSEQTAIYEAIESTVDGIPQKLQSEQYRTLPSYASLDGIELTSASFLDPTTVDGGLVKLSGDSHFQR